MHGGGGDRAVDDHGETVVLEMAGVRTIAWLRRVREFGVVYTGDGVICEVAVGSFV